MNPFTLRACAKINLGLDVLNKRADGFHSIRSIFVGIDLYDEIEFVPSTVAEVTCVPPVTTSPDQNIVARAQALYAKRFPSDTQTAKITVRKRIPTGAGLGGGSSDAAATLVALALINGRPNDDITQRLLLPLAEKLGSDVPFFLQPGVSLVEGRGELVTPLNLTIPWTILVVCPGIHINTAHAYSTLGIVGGKPNQLDVDNFRNAVDNQGLSSLTLINDFEPTIFAKHPTLAHIKKALLYNHALYATMSGSGSAMVGLFTGMSQAVHARAAFADMEAYICAPVNASNLIL